jgi:hypothetical protein
MRSPFDSKTLVGSFALLATFVLALPGVKTVRADEQKLPLASNDGPSCSQQGPEAALERAGPAMEQIRAQIAAQIDPATSGRIIVLNNRGYNYASGSTLDRTSIDLERLSAEQ